MIVPDLYDHISLADSRLVSFADTGVTDSAPHRISSSWFSIVNTTHIYQLTRIEPKLHECNVSD